MIITLTNLEVKRYVASALNLNPSGFVLEIKEGNLPPHAVALRTALAEFPASHEKIAAIKRFRDLLPRRPSCHYGGNVTECIYGLADCKWAIENPDEAVQNLVNTGVLR